MTGGLVVELRRNLSSSQLNPFETWKLNFTHVSSTLAREKDAKRRGFDCFPLRFKRSTTGSEAQPPGSFGRG
jgi:hypothetical protein